MRSLVVHASALMQSTRECPWSKFWKLAVESAMLKADANVENGKLRSKTRITKRLLQ